MPGFDGTGPRGLGPMTGRGRGFCVVKLDDEHDLAAGRLRRSPVGSAAAPGRRELELAQLRARAWWIETLLRGIRFRIEQLSSMRPGGLGEIGAWMR